MFKRALVSVSDKTGLVEFLRPWVSQGLQVVSTGGTARHLRDNGIEVIDVSEQTQFPEVMDGRVKTLHPRVHMALLARPGHAGDEQVLADNELQPFDLVVGNLYAFESALKKGLLDQELVEYVDIGGPSLLRAAAKNYQRITVICDPADYQDINSRERVDENERRRLAAKVFAHVSAYDAMVAQAFAGESFLGGPNFCLGGHLLQTLRYGENPQQKGFWYRQSGAKAGLHEAQILQGKALSYNNILDLEAAVDTLREFGTNPACVAVKHNNPCGVAVADSVSAAVNAALKADPVSVFGGIVAVNGTVDEACAESLTSLFLECVIAPDYSPQALQQLARKKNLRVLQWPQWHQARHPWQIKAISGGFVVQSADQVSPEWSESDWQVIGESPSAALKKELLFAWRVCAHLKSNAIAITGHQSTLGLGMGQVNRVDAVEQAVDRMRKFHADVKEPVLASDAFFPFADSIEKCAAAGIHWVIQPGGSLRDEEVINKAKELGVNLVMTGRRHFMH